MSGPASKQRISARQADIEVPARYYQRLCDLLEREGVDRRMLLSRARIRAESFDRPDGLLRQSQVERLVALAVELTGRSDLGLELGHTLTLSSHSIVGFGVLSSPDMERAIQFLARYFRLVMPSFRMVYTRHRDGVENLVTPTVGMSRLCLGLHLEAIAAAAYREIREISGGVLPEYHIQLSIPEPPHAARYRQFKGVRWSFDADRSPGVRVRFGVDLSRYPLDMADTNALRMAEDRCRSLIRNVTQSRRFSDWVTMMLTEASDGLPTRNDLAAALNLSPRTLDRYLKREGTGFREIAVRTQHALACRRLLEGRQSITEIAYSLGFTDAANFTRAFRAHAGCSPREFRERGAAD